MAVAVHVEIVDDGRATINLRHLRRRDAMGARMRVAKIPRRHEREKIHAQAEIKIGADGRAVVENSHACPISRARRQRRPAAIIIRVTPRHPRRRPDRVRPPAPAAARIVKPASVVKCRSAPRIIRKPIPARIGVDPMTVVAIWLPARIINHDRRLPAKPVAIHVHPVAVRREIVVKIILRDHGGLLGSIRLRCGLRRRRGGRRRPQLLVMLHHRRHRIVRQTEVFQINDLVGSQAKRRAGIADVGEDDAFIHARLRQPDDLRQRAVWRNVRRQRGIAGRRGRLILCICVRE